MRVRRGKRGDLKGRQVVAYSSFTVPIKDLEMYSKD